MKLTYKNAGIHAEFTAEMIDDVLCIEDLNLGKRSVTNDIDYVMEILAAQHKHAAHVIYRDSEGMWDEIVRHPDAPPGYFPLQKRTADEAIAALKESQPLVPNSKDTEQQLCHKIIDLFGDGIYHPAIIVKSLVRTLSAIIAQQPDPVAARDDLIGYLNLILKIQERTHD